jgi:hypothetical protein
MVDENPIPPGARPDTTGQPPTRRGETPEEVQARKEQLKEEIKQTIDAALRAKRQTKRNDIEEEADIETKAQALRNESSWRGQIKKKLESEFERVKKGPKNYEKWQRLERMPSGEVLKTVAATAGRGVLRGLSNIGFHALGGKRRTITESGVRAVYDYKAVHSLDDLGKALKEGWTIVSQGRGYWYLQRPTDITRPYVKTTKTVVTPGLIRGKKTVEIVEKQEIPNNGWQIAKNEITTTEIPGVISGPSPKDLTTASNLRPVAREIHATRGLLPRKYISPYAALAQGGTPIPTGYKAVAPPVFRLPPPPPRRKFGNGDIYFAWGSKFIDMTDMMGADVVRYQMQTAVSQRFGMLGKPIAMMGPIVSFNTFGLVPGRGRGNLSWVFSMPRPPRPVPQLRLRPQTISFPNKSPRYNRPTIRQPTFFNIKSVRPVNYNRYSSIRYQGGIRWF